MMSLMVPLVGGVCEGEGRGRASAALVGVAGLQRRVATYRLSDAELCG